MGNPEVETDFIQFVNLRSQWLTKKILNHIFNIKNLFKKLSYVTKENIYTLIQQHELVQQFFSIEYPRYITTTLQDYFYRGGTLMQYRPMKMNNRKIPKIVCIY